MKRTKEDLITLRSSYQDYDEAEKVMDELIAIYKKEYKPKHTPSQYYKLIRDWDIDAVERRHEQDEYQPDMVFETFSEVSQHIYGMTKEHCYDQIWDAVVAKKERIEEYKKLPTLKELVESDIEINPEEMYYTKEKGSYDDSRDGHSGSIILEMREIGIEAWRNKRIKKEWDFFTQGMTEKDWDVIRKSLRERFGYLDK